MKHIVEFIEAAASFQTENMPSPHTHEELAKQASSFQDPFCTNPFAGLPDGATVQAPLSRGPPGKLVLLCN
jgi:hypothetical protein